MRDATNGRGTAIFSMGGIIAVSLLLATGHVAAAVKIADRAAMASDRTPSAMLEVVADGTDPSLPILEIRDAADAVKTVITSVGKIGIGTASPATVLDVIGPVRIGSTTDTCTPAIDGALRFNATSPEYCDGSQWRGFGGNSVQIGGNTYSEALTPLIWLDTTPSATSANSLTPVKSFTLPGQLLAPGNAVDITCYRRRTSGNASVKVGLAYGGSQFFSSGVLSNEVGRIDMTLFADGTTMNQRAYLDDANTGDAGARTGTLGIDSLLDQTVQILAETSNNSTQVTVDNCKAVAIINPSP